MVETFPFLVMLWNEACKKRIITNPICVVLLTVSKHSINMGLHVGGSLGLLGWQDMVQGGCQNPPIGNSFSGRVCVVSFFYLWKIVQILFAVYHNKNCFLFVNWSRVVIRATAGLGL